ncbi:MAG: hypothetical protein L0211_13100 [Planctomycetaceae bacterium]|nr:hypothetical protein [Planctomycetaceae bacterium]
MTDEAPTQNDQIEELSQKVRAWVGSESGRKVIEQVVTEAVKAQLELMKARRIDPQSLNKPVNL